MRSDPYTENMRPPTALGLQGHTCCSLTPRGPPQMSLGRDLPRPHEKADPVSSLFLTPVTPRLCPQASVSPTHTAGCCSTEPCQDLVSPKAYLCQPHVHHTHTDPNTQFNPWHPPNPTFLHLPSLLLTPSIDSEIPSPTDTTGMQEPALKD